MPKALRVLRIAVRTSVVSVTAALAWQKRRVAAIWDLSALMLVKCFSASRRLMISRENSESPVIKSVQVGAATSLGLKSRRVKK